jgi:hypothetical protein
MPSPIDNLKAFRVLLVEERRRVVADALDVAKTANLGAASRLKGGHGLELKALQEQIEAIDKAIADEENRASEESS